VIYIRILLILLFSPILLLAQSSSKNFSFSEISVSPLTTAQGVNHTASGVTDVLQTFANPAFSDSTVDNNLHFAYLNYLTDINQTSLAYAKMVDSFGLVSGYFRYLDYGTFQETDEVGNELGEFKTSEYEIGVSVSKNYRQNFYYGGTFKQMFSSFYSNSAYGLALDIGGYYQGENGLQLGITLDDIGFRVIEFNNGQAGLFRPSINIGASKKFSKAPIILGLQYNNIETWDLASSDIDQSDNLIVDQLTGVSKRRTLTFDNFARHLNLNAIIAPSDKFNLIVGFDFRRRLELAANQRPALVGFSFGIQAKIKKFNLQYGVSSYHLNGAINHLALSTNLNEWHLKKSK